MFAQQRAPIVELVLCVRDLLLEEGWYGLGEW